MYKEIDFSIEVYQDAIICEKKLRIERFGLWYDLRVTKEYPRNSKNFIDDFIDYCIAFNLSWQPNLSKYKKYYLGDKPSDLQIDIKDVLMKNQERVNRIKKELKLN